MDQLIMTIDDWSVSKQPTATAGNKHSYQYKWALALEWKQT